MAANRGDKVRFLNAEGGGIVSHTDGRTVYVEDEDGFEIPVSISDVVVVEVAAKQKQEVEERKKEERRNEVPEIIEEQGYSYKDDNNVEPQFYLAFLKSDNGQSGNIDLFAINDSNLFAFFTLAEYVGDTKDVRIMHYGTLEPNTKLSLAKYNPQRIDNQTWKCQIVLFRKNKAYTPMTPIDTEIKVKATKFFRDNTFVENDFFDSRAVLYPLIEDELQNKIAELSETDLHKIARDKERSERKQVSKKSNVNEIIEVDLHIDAILDSTAGLSNNEMLQIQMARFRHVMEENMNRKGQRIVFIHGVGNGTLKNEVRKTLDRTYRKCNYQDASFREYGYGATMVIIG